LDDLVSDYRVAKGRSLASVLSYIKTRERALRRLARRRGINFRAMEASIAKRRERRRAPQEAPCRPPFGPPVGLVAGSYRPG
jgi:hypothetical protein